METTLWQLALALILLSLVYAEQLSRWIRARIERRAVFPLGYILATVYAFGVVLFFDATFAFRPLPRYEDVFLIGIALAAYFFGSAPAAYLLGIAMAVSAWVLPPTGSFGIDSALDWYRFISFGIVSVLMICTVGGLRKAARRRPASQGYFFASAYAVIGSLLVIFAFHAYPVPRFNDIFTVGIALTAYYFAAAPATYLLVLSVGITMWMLPPNGTFAISDPADYYRLLSFTAVSGLVIFIMHRLKESGAAQQRALDGDFRQAG